MYKTADYFGSVSFFTW